MQVGFFPIYAGEAQGGLDGIHRKVGVFEDAQRDQVDGYRNAQYELLMYGRFLDEWNQKEVGQCQAENQQTV